MNDVPIQVGGGTDVLAGKKILIVEDDKFLRDLIGLRFSHEKSEMFYASSGKEAIAIAQTTPLDLILLDIILPGMDGFAIIEALKKDPKTAPLRIVVLSNLSGDADKERAKKLGAEGFLVKAMYTPEEIVGEVRKLLHA